MEGAGERAGDTSKCLSWGIKFPLSLAEIEGPGVEVAILLPDIEFIDGKGLMPLE